MYPSDLELAVAGFEKALHTLATHPAALPHRLLAAAADVSSGCPWNRRPRLPADLPVGLRPPDDLPTLTAERMRMVLGAMTDGTPTTEQAVGIAGDVAALGADLKQLDAHLRRTTPLLVLAVTPEDVERQPSDEELLRSGVWSEEHLVTLGRIVEEAASNESLLRTILGRALRLPDGGYARQRYAEALFLGSRVPDMVKKLKAVADLYGVPDWMPDAVAWATSAHKADLRRNELLHRPPAFVVTAGEWRPGMSPARRTQEAEILTSQALDVLRELEAVARAGMQLMTLVYAPEGDDGAPGTARAQRM